MTDKDYHKKASEVFNETKFPFTKKGSFDEAFPEIEDVTIEVKEDGKKSSYSKQFGIEEYIDCTNPLCYRGGFSIGSILREMVSKKQTELETSELCRGHEGSPKGKRIDRQCVNFFEIKVFIKYRESDNFDKEKL